MEPQIYMWSGAREIFLARHDFYIEQVRVRVLNNFDNMEEEADRVAQEVYDRIGSTYSDGDVDMSVAADTAMEHGLGFYLLLSEMKSQTMLGAVASLYHQWDKTLRGFMERELSHTYDRDEVTKCIWPSNIEELFNLLEEFGWPLRQAQWYPPIKACHLIVNVYKHGKGRSLDELAQNYPQYLKGLFENTTETSLPRPPDHEDLEVTDEEFDHIAAALRQFWVEFPERLVPVTT